MSATLDVGALASWLDGEVIHCEGRAFPLDIRHLAPTGESASSSITTASRCARSHSAPVSTFFAM